MSKRGASGWLCWCRDIVGKQGQLVNVSIYPLPGHYQVYEKDLPINEKWTKRTNFRLKIELSDQ